MNRNKRSITDLARELRKNPTNSEVQLWKLLRRKQLNGYKFLRQKPLIYHERYRIKSFFIADFYCSRLRFVIEVDGKIHDYQKHYDKERDKVILELGLEILRVKNKETNYPEVCKRKILRKIEDIEQAQDTTQF